MKRGITERGLLQYQRERIAKVNQSGVAASEQLIDFARNLICRGFALGKLCKFNISMRGPAAFKSRQKPEVQGFEMRSLCAGLRVINRRAQKGRKAARDFHARNNRQIEFIHANKILSPSPPVASIVLGSRERSSDITPTEMV